MKLLKSTLAFTLLLFFFQINLTAQVDRPGEIETDGGKGEIETERVTCDNWWEGPCGSASSIFRTGSVHIGGTGNANSAAKFQVSGKSYFTGHIVGKNNVGHFVLRAAAAADDPLGVGPYMHMYTEDYVTPEERGKIAIVTRGEGGAFHLTYNEGNQWHRNLEVRKTGEMIARRSLELNTGDAETPLKVTDQRWGEHLFTVEKDGQAYGRSLRIGTNYWNEGSDRFRVEENGKVIIGNADAASEGFLLSVADGIQTQQVKVCANANDWCDYVFAEDYKLNSIEKVEAHIKEHKHLPNVPSAQEVEENGINVAEMDATLLRQVEELWLHVIELKKENAELKKLIVDMK